MAANRYGWLSSEPLITFINAYRGGIQGVLKIDPSGDHYHGSPVVGHPEKDRVLRGWHRAVRSGRVTERWADDFCTRILHVNPALIWGEEWWSLDSEVA